MEFFKLAIPGVQLPIFTMNIFFGTGELGDVGFQGEEGDKGGLGQKGRPGRPGIINRVFVPQGTQSTKFVSYGCINQIIPRR